LLNGPQRITWEPSKCSSYNDEYDELYDVFQQLLHKSSKLYVAHKQLKYDFKDLQSKFETIS